MDNIRDFLNFNKAYYDVNREERNLVAIFYHLLLINDNLNRFLELIDCREIPIKDEMGIYFEYAFLRDLWDNIDKKYKYGEDSNIVKRNLIYNFLKPNNTNELKEMNIEEFNRYFGAVSEGKSAKKHIISPSQWSISRYNDTIAGSNEFLKVSKFKWAFNVKPDIVIHISLNYAICIECKLESDESFYPKNSIEKDLFNAHNLKKVPQTEIQKYLMDLLGIKTQFVFLVQKDKANSKSHKVYFWKDIFSELNRQNCPKNILVALDRL